MEVMVVMVGYNRCGHGWVDSGSGGSDCGGNDDKEFPS